MALCCVLWLTACASSAREPRVMMPMQPQSYIRTYPPAQQGSVPNPASRRYAQSSAQKPPSLLYPPQMAPLNVETATPRRPVIYPQTAGGPGLRMIQDRPPAIPTWARQQETVPSSALSSNPNRTPTPYTDPEYAPRQTVPAQASRQSVPPYVPSARQQTAPSARMDTENQYSSSAPTQTFVPPTQKFDARVTGGGSRYDIQQSEPAAQPARAHWWLFGDSELASASELVSPAAKPASAAPVSKRSTPAYTPTAAALSGASPDIYSAPGTSAPLPAMAPSVRAAPFSAATAYVGGESRGIILGAGDVVTINVLGRPELTATVDVTGAGAINVPLAGDVPVAGLSTSEAAARVEEALRGGDFVINPQVTLTTTETRSQQVSVLGEVKQPGRFKIETRTTVMDGLAQAGGISETGMNFAYILRREGGVVARYEMDIDALIEAGAGQQYFELQPGDTVIVPKADLFYIYGEVRAPNAYKLKPGMGVIQALSLAGGLTDKGSDRRIEIRRRGADGGLHTFGVNLSDPIYPEDVIYVKERFF